jgi:hypothetical protein
MKLGFSKLLQDKDKDWFTALPGADDVYELAMTYVVENEDGTSENEYSVRRLLAGKY